VGFPGETEEEFQQTREFLENIGFYEMHVFKYSKREGTRAAVMPQQVPDTVKTLRSNELLQMEKRQSKEFRSCYIGQTTEILVEEVKEIAGKSFWLGHTRDYVKIALPASDAEVVLDTNMMVMVKVQAFLTDEILVAEAIKH